VLNPQFQLLWTQTLETILTILVRATIESNNPGALVQALNSPELDVRLVVTACGNTNKRAQIVAKLLAIANCDNIIAIGIGIATNSAKFVGPGSQYEWAEDFDISSYGGKVIQDGVQAIIETVNSYYERSVAEGGKKITLICIAPLTNIASAFERAPEIIQRVEKVVIMAGQFEKKKGRI